ncbi:hypothetical protein KR038_005446 [Drosophila bunnanda]|nr:hypothetical protein KR038_005446 [Drosophila bunnanda]
MAEKDAMWKILLSDEEEEDEKKSDESAKENTDSEKKEGKGKDDAVKNKNKKIISTKDDKKAKSNGIGDSTDTDCSSDITDSEDDLTNGPPKKKTASKEKDKEKKDKESAAASGSSNANKSLSATPTPSTGANKRKMNSLPSDLTGLGTSNRPTSKPAKMPKNEISNSLHTSFSGTKVEDYGITEEAVRRCLKRKPLTAPELLSKLKKKKVHISRDRFIETMTKILKKINPVKLTIQGKMYFWIK